MIHRRGCFSLLLAALLVPFALALPPLETAGAQSSDEGWQSPINLSQSGAASNPMMVADSNGVIHLLWEDEFAGQYHIQGDGQQWSEPAPTQFPFAGRQPVLLSGLNGWIHAIWINDTGRLLYSRALASGLHQGGSWDRSLMIMDDVLDFDAGVDEQGGLHIAMLKGSSQGSYPAGAYFIRSTPNGLSWGQIQSIFESPYLRNLTHDQANIDLAVGNSHLFIAWDVPSRKQVYLASSQDEGENWGEPAVIDGPDEGNPGAQPSRIEVYSTGGPQVLLTWHSQSLGPCQMMTRWSPDGGQTWSESTALSRDLQGCTDTSELLPSGSQQALLLTRVNGQSYLLRWDGEAWSIPEIQRTLAGFEDTETFSNVGFVWTRALLSPSGQILVIGYDGSGNGDVWITARSIVDEFSSEAVSGWNIPGEVTNSAGSLSFSLLAADSADRFHFLWVEDQALSGSDSRSTIGYSVWEGDRFSTPSEPFDNASGSLDQPSATVTAGDLLLLALRKAETGEVLFSQAPVDRAYSADEWTQFQVLSPRDVAGAWPVVLSTPSGDIYLSYTIPVNEGRGVYLTHSADRGRSWSEPVQVFDGAVWEVVGPAKLAYTGGALHLLVEERSLFGGDIALRLGYARVTVEGQVQAGQEVTGGQTVRWDALISPDGRTVYRIWEEANGQHSIHYQYSMDEGRQWSTVGTVGVPGFVEGTIAVVADSAGQLHLLGISQADSGKPVLQHLQWNGERWALQEPAYLDDSKQYQDLSVSVSPDGKLGVALLAETIQSESVSQHQLSFLSREIQLPERLSVLPTFTPAPIAGLQGGTSQPETTQTPQVTPTPDLAALQLAGVPQEGSGAAGDNKWAGLVAGAGLSVAFLVVLFVFQAWRMNSRRL